MINLNFTGSLLKYIKQLNQPNFNFDDKNYE